MRSSFVAVLVRLIPAALILCVSGLSFAEDYIEYVNRTDRFGVSFPGQPMVRDATYMSEEGTTLPARVYVVEDGPRRYSVTVVNYMVCLHQFIIPIFCFEPIPPVRVVG